MDLADPMPTRRRPRRGSAAAVLRSVPPEAGQALADGAEIVETHEQRVRLERRAHEPDAAPVAWRVYRVTPGGDEYLADLDAPPRPAWCAAYGAGRYRWIPVDEAGNERTEAARSLVVGASPVGGLASQPPSRDPLTGELVRALGQVLAQLAARPQPASAPAADHARDDRLLAMLERLALERAAPAPTARGDASTWQTAFFEGLKLGRELQPSDDRDDDTIGRIAAALPQIAGAFTARGAAQQTPTEPPERLDRVAELRRAVSRFTPDELRDLIHDLDQPPGGG